MRMIYLIVTQSFLWAVASLLLLAAPHAIFLLFGMELSPTSSALARVFGAELTGLTLASYFTRHLVYGPRCKNLAMAYTASNTLGFVVTGRAMMLGSMSSFTWVLCGLYFIYAVGFAYFRFFDKKEHEQRIEGAHGLVA
jgi:hypothetical protein